MRRAAGVPRRRVRVMLGRAQPEGDQAMTRTEMRRCTGSAHFGIEPHDAPIGEFPKQPSRKDGLGTMCTPHWKTYVKGLNADRKARATSGEAPNPGRTTTEAEPKATTKRERRRTPMAH